MSNSSTETDSCMPHTECPPGKYASAEGSATRQITCNKCAPGFFKALTSRTSTEKCIPHAKCPPGKYAQTAGNSTAQPQCEGCAHGFFNGFTPAVGPPNWATSTTGAILSFRVGFRAMLACTAKYACTIN